MLLVFAVVFVFLWAYLKQFPHGHRLKMVLVVVGVGLLVSLLASYPPVYNFFSDARPRNPLYVWLSFPFHLDGEAGPSDTMLNIGKAWFRIYLVGVHLWEMEVNVRYTGEGGYIFPSWQMDVDITASVLFQLFLIFTALNMLGTPLAAAVAVIYMTTIWEKESVARAPLRI